MSIDDVMCERHGLRADLLRLARIGDLVFDLWPCSAGDGLAGDPPRRRVYERIGLRWQQRNLAIVARCVEFDEEFDCPEANAEYALLLLRVRCCARAEFSIGQFLDLGVNDYLE